MLGLLEHDFYRLDVVCGGQLTADYFTCTRLAYKNVSLYIFGITQSEMNRFLMFFVARNPEKI